VQVAKKNCC